METTHDEEFNIPDPTDWKGTPLAGLEQVEQALRCHICKDFYNSPMITSCNHTFCSLCIRRCLLQDGKCPLCRANDQESKLRGNWSLREAVEAFVKSRDQLLRIAKTPAPASPKRKASELGGTDEGIQETKRLRISTRSTRSRDAEATAAMIPLKADLDSKHPCSQDPPESPESPESPEEPDDGLVACPICWTRMKPLQVDKHLDTSCPGSQPQAPPQSTSRAHNSRPSAFQSPPKAPERLAPLAYSFLKDKDLRKKMSDLGLPTGGTRQMLEKRHQEWVTIWNANCDSARPKRKSELLSDLDVWERTVGSRAPSMSKAAVIGAQIKDKDFDGAAWAAKHDDSFKNLIANARRTRMQAQQKAKEAAESEPQPGPAKEEVKEAQPRQEAHPQPPPSVPAAGNLTKPSPHSQSPYNPSAYNNPYNQYPYTQSLYPASVPHSQPPPSIPAVGDLIDPSLTDQSRYNPNDPSRYHQTPYRESIPHPQQLSYMQQQPIANAHLGGYHDVTAYPNGAHFDHNKGPYEYPEYDIPPRGSNWDTQYRRGPPS